MVFSHLTPCKYVRGLIVVEYKLNSESNAKRVYLCQNVILGSNLRSFPVTCSQSKGRRAVLSWVHVCSWAMLGSVLLWALRAGAGIQKEIYNVFSSDVNVWRLNFLSLLSVRAQWRDGFTPVSFEKATDH